MTGRFEKETFGHTRNSSGKANEAGSREIRGRSRHCDKRIVSSSSDRSEIFQTQFEKKVRQLLR